MSRESGLKAFWQRLITVFKFRANPLTQADRPRVYPELPIAMTQATLPVSFVVVRFSAEYLHNFLKSECVHDGLNEVIEVNNTSNLFFDNLSQAIIAGLDRARNDIIAVIHEDVLLPDGWQARFEQSLRQLETHDPGWGVLGSVGWNSLGQFVGHWSDPHQFKNTFSGSECPFQQVVKLDEQLLIFHRDRLPKLDSNLPGIHFLGEDLNQQLSRDGLRCYAIDAPTIHKYADKNGAQIFRSIQSEKISDRDNATYLADEACCKDYLSWKYPNVFFPVGQLTNSAQLSDDRLLQASRPIIFICKGEMEAAVMRKLAQASGVFLAEEVNEAGGPSALTMPIYKMIVEKYRCHASWQKHNTMDTLQVSAARMIENLPVTASWGVILPESILVLPELARAFPNARYVYCQRDPLGICLDGAQGTARLDNHIGRIALPQAYTSLGLGRARILDDEEMDHKVYTTIHQLELVNQHMVDIAESEPLILRIEDFVHDPVATMERFCHWLGAPKSREAIRALNIELPLNSQADRHASALASVVAARLTGIRESLGYI